MEQLDPIDDLFLDDGFERLLWEEENRISLPETPPSLNLTELATDRWWGPGDPPAKPDTNIHCARIVYDENVVESLKNKLRNSRTNLKPLDGVGFTYGFNQINLANWTEYWLNKYDFDAQEANWNKYPAYKTNIQGMDIFFFRITPQVDENTELIPVLMMHGWPSSPQEFFDAVPYLTAVNKDRDFAVDLILASLPGFGYSQGAARPGLGAPQMSVVMRNLMHRLGYKKFYVQGGDYGSITLSNMVTRFPDEVLGYHTNYGLLLSPTAIFLQMLGDIYPSLVIQESVQNRTYPLSTKFNNLMPFMGYFLLQATRPDTIGVALTESPLALLGYLFEKFSIGSSKFNILREDGGLFDSPFFSPEYLLDTAMYYWTSNSIQNSMRIYAETYNKFQVSMRIEEIPTPVPSWFFASPEELTYQSPIVLSLKYRNILGETVFDKGGHFVPKQYPKEFAEDVLKALTVFREWHAANGTNTSVV